MGENLMYALGSHADGGADLRECGSLIASPEESFGSLLFSIEVRPLSGGEVLESPILGVTHLRPLNCNERLAALVASEALCEQLRLALAAEATLDDFEGAAGGGASPDDSPRRFHTLIKANLITHVKETLMSEDSYQDTRDE